MFIIRPVHEEEILPFGAFSCYHRIGYTTRCLVKYPRTLVINFVIFLIEKSLASEGAISNRGLRGIGYSMVIGDRPYIKTINNINISLFHFCDIIINKPAEGTVFIVVNI